MQIQLEQIYKEVAKNRMLDFDIVPVQQQKGAADCGVHSVANAFNAAIGKNLETITKFITKRKCVNICKTVLKSNV